MQLTDSTFIVTGGGSGLGEATVRLFRAGGANVVIADINVEKSEALANELGERVEFRKINVADEAEAAAVVDLAASKFGGLQGLVNCAGIAIGEKVLGKNEAPHRIDSFSRCISINLIGTFNMIRRHGEG